MALLIVSWLDSFTRNTGASHVLCEKVITAMRVCLLSVDATSFLAWSCISRKWWCGMVFDESSICQEQERFMNFGAN
jgi:hypothetical protein